MFVLDSNFAPKNFHNDDKRIFHHPKNSIKHIFHPFFFFLVHSGFFLASERKITEIFRQTTALDRQSKIETNKAEEILSRLDSLVLFRKALKFILISKQNNFFDKMSFHLDTKISFRESRTMLIHCFLAENFSQTNSRNTEGC